MTERITLFNDKRKIATQSVPTLRLYNGVKHEPFYRQGGDTAALLVHGFPGTPAEMRPISDVLHDHGWTVQGLLLPGFGRSIEAIGQYGWCDWAAKVEQAVDTLRATHARVVLIGNSMGGALCLDVAARGYGDALLLIAPFWRIANHWLDSLYPVGRLILPNIRPFFRADFADDRFRATLQRIMPDVDLDDRGVQTAIREIDMPTSVFGQIREGGRAAFASAARVTQPVTIVQGAGDEVVSTPRTQRLAQRCPNLTAFWQVQGDHEIALLDGPNRTAMTALIQQFVRNYDNSRPPVKL